MSCIKQRASYAMSSHALGVLENSMVWDSKFLLSRAKVVGLLPVDPYQKECGSSMSTKKL